MLLHIYVTIMVFWPAVPLFPQPIGWASAFDFAGLLASALEPVQSYQPICRSSWPARRFRFPEPRFRQGSSGRFP